MIAGVSRETPSLEFEAGDAQWQALRDEGLRNLYFMASVILGYGELVPMREGPHRLLCKVVERRTGIPAIDDAWVRKVEMPRGTGKTTVVTQAYIIQRLCQEPNLSILLCNEKEGNAKAILGAIKSQFEQNELFRKLYPEVIPDDFHKVTWSATEMNVKRTTHRKESSIMIIGEGGTKTGMHPDEIFVDDIISRELMESMRAGSVADLIGQINRWIHQLVPLLSGHPKRCLTFIGTRWWHNDCYEHIEESFGYGQHPQRFLLKTTLPDGSTQRLPVYRVGDLVVFRRAAIEDGQPAFLELDAGKYGLEGLAKLRLQDPELFAANYLNQPADEVTATFKEAWLRFYDWIDDEQVRFVTAEGKTKVVTVSSMDTMALVDPGGFGTGKGRNRARPAFWVIGMQPQDAAYLGLHAWSEATTYLACQQELVTTFAKLRVRKAFIERKAQQIAFIDGLRELCRKAGVDTIIEEIGFSDTKSKDDRILGLEGYFQRGQLYVGRGAMFHEFRTQYSQFPKSARNDLLDALAWGPAVWPKLNGGQRNQAQRQRQELAQYYQRRGVG